jgi:hypothetical protein
MHRIIVRNGWAKLPKAAFVGGRIVVSATGWATVLRQAARHDLLAESRKHRAAKLL